ncbi:solute carrier family 53 member 1-like [Engraulis encrasicolus]|uniref:solute carrier family 53 member 1-like n=1 Tax=Engraulis encrasicolus TaxID=184585 RepID=UPI002FD24855
MRFSELLAAHTIPEWKRKYVCYGVLLSEYQTYLKAAHQEFFRCCENELTKVTCFYSAKLLEAKRRMAEFGSCSPVGTAPLETMMMMTMMMSQEETEAQQAQTTHGGRCSGRHGDHNMSDLLRVCRGNPDFQQLRLATSELHLSLLYLQSYQQLNYNAFSKIMKKYDTKFESERGQWWKTEVLDTSLLCTDCHWPHQLMEKLEVGLSLMVHLEGEDRQKALQSLRAPKRGLPQSEQKWIMFRIGVVCGLLITLLLLIFITAQVNTEIPWEEKPSSSSSFSSSSFFFYSFNPVVQGPDWGRVSPSLRAHRGCFLLLEFLLLLGASLHLWHHSGVNHVLIFQLDPREHLSHQHLFQVAGALGVCWCCSVLACLCPPLVTMPPLLPPVLLHCLLLLLLLNPTPTCYPHARRWLRDVLLRVVTAPLWPVAFADCWLSDQLNSLSPLLLDLWHLFCSYGNTGSDTSDYLPAEQVSSLAVTCLIQCLPPWLRLVQCLRQFWDTRDIIHLLNAGKYSTVFLMVMFAGLYNRARVQLGQVWEVNVCVYLWAVSTCFSVLVCVSWDLLMDWTLLQGHGLLRKELLYTHEV